jgi:hypothetical protein
MILVKPKKKEGAAIAMSNTQKMISLISIVFNFYQINERGLTAPCQQ